MDQIRRARSQNASEARWEGDRPGTASTTGADDDYNKMDGETRAASDARFAYLPACHANFFEQPTHVTLMGTGLPRFSSFHVSPGHDAAAVPVSRQALDEEWTLGDAVGWRGATGTEGKERGAAAAGGRGKDVAKEIQDRTRCANWPRPVVWGCLGNVPANRAKLTVRIARCVWSRDDDEAPNDIMGRESRRWMLSFRSSISATCHCQSTAQQEEITGVQGCSHRPDDRGAAWHWQWQRALHSPRLCPQIGVQRPKARYEQSTVIILPLGSWRAQQSGQVSVINRTESDVQLILRLLLRLRCHEE